MATTEKGAVLHSEHSKPAKRQRVKRICARWWWLFLLVLACVVLIIILPIVYVGYPKLARRAVRESSLEITSISITNPAPDHVDLAFQQVFYTDSKYHPTLYPFNASLYLVDNPDNPPFVSVQTPKLKASNGTTSEVKAQRVNITHPEEFTRYVLLALASDEFEIALRGHGNLKQGILPKVSVDYDKNISTKGLNRLAGFSLLSFQVLNGTESDGTNAIGMASIPNPSVMEVDLGRVVLGMSVNGTDVGVAVVESLVLKPGNNTIELRAQVYQLVVVGIVLARGSAVIPVDIKGINSTFDGQLIPYYTTLLGATALQVELNVTKAIEGSNLTETQSAAIRRLI